MINLSANVFFFGDFNSHHKAGIPILVELIDLILNDLTQMVNFPTGIPDCDSHSPTLMDLFLSSDASICSRKLPLHWEIVIMLLSQFPLTFHHIHNGMPHLIA